MPVQGLRATPETPVPDSMHRIRIQASRDIDLDRSGGVVASAPIRPPQPGLILGLGWPSLMWTLSKACLGQGFYPGQQGI